MSVVLCLPAHLRVSTAASRGRPPTGTLYRNGKLLVLESRVLGLCEALHHHMLHPGVKKQALDMQRRFEIDHIGHYTAIKKVRKGCSVCQACNPDNRNVKGEAQWTPVPD